MNSSGPSTLRIRRWLLHLAVCPPLALAGAGLLFLWPDENPELDSLASARSVDLPSAPASAEPPPLAAPSPVKEKADSASLSDPLREPDTLLALDLAHRICAVKAAGGSPEQIAPDHGPQASDHGPRGEDSDSALFGGSPHDLTPQQAVALLLQGLEVADESEAALSLGRALERLAQAELLVAGDLEGLLPRLRHASARIALIRVRSSLTDEGLLPLLEGVARQDSSYEVRAEALALIASRGEAEEASRLIEELVAREPGLLRPLSRLLPRLPLLRQTLHRALASEQVDLAVRRSAALALYAAGGDSRLQVERLAGSENPGHLAATEALIRGLPRSEGPLREVLASGMKGEARRSALVGLFRAGRIKASELESLSANEPLLAPEVNRLLDAAAQEAAPQPAAIANTQDPEPPR